MTKAVVVALVFSATEVLVRNVVFYAQSTTAVISGRRSTSSCNGNSIGCHGSNRTAATK